MTKRDKIKLLLKMNNRDSNLSEDIFSNILNSLGEDINDPEFDEFKEYMIKKYAEIHEKYLEEQIDAYDKHLSELAIDASIEFYTTASGIEIADKMPMIGKELARAGIKVSMEIAKEFKTKLNRQAEIDYLEIDYLGFDPGVEQDSGEPDSIAGSSLTQAMPPGTMNPQVPRDAVNDDTEAEFEEFLKRYGLK